MFKVGDKVVAIELIRDMDGYTNLLPNVQSTIFEISLNKRFIMLEENQNFWFSINKFKLFEESNNYLQAGPMFKIGSYVMLKIDGYYEKRKPYLTAVADGLIHKIIASFAESGYVFLDIKDSNSINIENLILYSMAEKEIEEYNLKYTTDFYISDGVVRENFPDEDSKIEKMPLYQDNPIMVDKLQEILDKQSSLQDRLNTNPKYMSFTDRIRYMMDNIVHINIEFAEFISLFPFKAWKHYSQEELKDFRNKEHRQEAIKEYIDIFHFVVNIGLAIDITSDELYDAYMKKNQENIERQNNKY